MSDETSDLHAEVAALRKEISELEQKFEQKLKALEQRLGGDDDSSVSFPAGGPGP